jgi:hypothetical protein
MMVVFCPMQRWDTNPSRIEQKKCLCYICSYITAEADADVLPYPQPAARKKAVGGAQQHTSQEAYEAKSKHAPEKRQREEDKERHKQDRIDKQKQKAKMQLAKVQKNIKRYR